MTPTKTPKLQHKSLQQLHLCHSLLLCLWHRQCPRLLCLLHRCTACLGTMVLCAVHGQLVFPAVGLMPRDPRYPPARGAVSLTGGRLQHRGQLSSQHMLRSSTW